ncbi:MAG TPA: glycosyltransferase [Gemmatimonadaceae bacterium]
MIGALPWIVTPVVTAIRIRRSTSLDDESGSPPADPPLVSVVIPARNEARNIERCVRSVLLNDYPRYDVTIVDDASIDGTGDIAREIVKEDGRVRVVETSGLPEGWFGKQWACETGARSTSGEIILFADADTIHSNDLITRSVNMMTRRNADLFSVMGRQELGSFWERVIQPQVFSIMSVRYGGMESITNSPRVKDKIANGQCLFVRRDTYNELGGHSLVKSHVADDMMMAQRYFARGKRVVLTEGLNQLSTRMYTSLRELIHGWGKNVFAGGRDAVPLGAFGQVLFPFLLLSGPLIGLAPTIVLLAALFFPVSATVLLWAVIADVALLLWWLYVYRSIREPLWYVPLFPLGAAVTLFIFLRAISRGRSVSWKDRQYISQ